MKYELMLLLKQRSIWLLLLISLILTTLSLQNGWQNITHIRAQILHAQQAEALRMQDYLQAHTTTSGPLEAGDIGYYVFHNVYHAPGEWSFIALGNRLVTPYVQRIRLLGLQGQLYDGESHHPEYVMLGSFDYAFWLVFFAPLLCIALLHDLKASEQQAHRLMFLNSLLARPAQFWCHRVLARWLLISAPFVLPVVLFTSIHALTLQPLLHIVSITLLYTLCWTALCAAISLRARALNASFNALTLACLWLLWCVVLPNLAQAWCEQHIPLQEGSQIALQHRQYVHGAWDLPKTDTLTPFYALYPQWRDSPPVTGRFHWKWYYAFQHMADVQLAPQVALREEALIKRDIATQQLSMVLPGLWVQRQFEEIAQSNVTHLLAHRQQIERFHTQLRHYLYPFLFEDKPVSAEDFRQMPTFSSALHQVDG